MKKSIVALLAGLTFAGAAWACSTNTYIINNKIVTCTTCCYGNNCTTNCF